MSQRPQTYQRISQLGPDWFPQGVPTNTTQIVAKSFQQGYGSLTHNAPSPPSGYFSAVQAYDLDEIRKCGYQFLKRKCDGSLA